MTVPCSSGRPLSRATKSRPRRRGSRLARLLGFALTLASAVAIPARANESAAATAVPAPLRALQAEVRRAMSLSISDMPPPHHAYAALIGDDDLEIQAKLGALVVNDRSRARLLKVEVRIGDARFDSSNFDAQVEPALMTSEVPVEDDAFALRREAWLLFDQSYKNATEAYEAKRAHREGRADAELPPADFSPAPTTRWIGETPGMALDASSLVALARSVSRVFVAFPAVHDSSVRILVRNRQRALVDSGGIVVREGVPLARIEIACRTQAEDGMPLASFASFSAASVDALPSEPALLAEAKSIAQQLTAMRDAPVVEDYAGPVLFEDVAAGQLLRVLLADELSATPAPEPQVPGLSARRPAFEGRLGWRVLTPDVDVVDDPSRTQQQGLPLIGGYRFDDEGVAAQAVSVVVGGRLSSLLGGRIPSRDLAASNGHGRAGPTSDARGRASNLIVTTRNGVSEQDLRRQLLALARREGLPYALVVRKLDDPAVTGDALASRAPSVLAGATLPLPVVLLRLHLDGREELVRGGELQALRTRDLRHMVAMGRRPAVYSYFASSSPVRAVGAGTGDIPTSIVAPSLLLPDADVRKSTGRFPRPPVLRRPLP